MDLSHEPGPDTEKDTLLSDHLEDGGQLSRSATSRCMPLLYTQWYWIAFLWGLSILATAGLTRSLGPTQYSVADRIASLSWHSPVYKDIDLHLDPVLQNGTIWYDADNIFRRDPSPEVDAAWGNLSHDFHVAISKSEWIKMGLPADKGVKWEGDPTGQTHLLHCLDVIRKAAFLEYYEPKKPLSPFYWLHFYHCLDMIRQEIMCQAPLDLYPVVWMSHQDIPMPYFNVNRMCRRWEDVVKYRDAHWIDQDDIGLQKKKAGQAEYQMPREGLELAEQMNKWHKIPESEFRPIHECS